MYRSETLSIQFPFGRTLGLALVFIFLFWGGGEVTLRLLVAATLLPEPYLGTINPEFDIKLGLLERMVRQNGQVDCIFLGSSQFDQAANPEVFSQVYARLSGKQITCFNFSLQTLTAAPAGRVARLLNQRYQPKLLVYGMSARDLSRDFGELARPLMDEPWLRAQLGEQNIVGWLTDASYTWRIANGLRNATQAEYWRVLDNLRTGINPYGFIATTANDLSNTKKNFIPTYIPSAEDMAGLDDILRLRTQTTRVLIVEVPVHPSFLPFYVEASPQAYQQKFVQPVSSLVNGRQIPFWQAQDAMTQRLPDTAWHDVRHLNAHGAEIYSTWLAQRLYDAVSTQQIQDPF